MECSDDFEKVDKDENDRQLLTSDFDILEGIWAAGRKTPYSNGCVIVFMYIPNCIDFTGVKCYYF